MKIVTVIDSSKTPKYKQIIASIEKAIEDGNLKKGDKLPSLNKIKDQFSLSRDTVLIAFNELKSRGIIQSIVGKGYYVKSEDVTVNKKIFLLFDELNAFKEDLFSSFTNYLGDGIQVDIFFHHFNSKVFAKLIEDNLGDYNYYIIMPANVVKAKDSISILPADKVYLLDQTNSELSAYPSVHQNFEKNVYDGLTGVNMLLEKYSKIVLLFSAKRQPIGILKGLELFCLTNNISYEVIEGLQVRKPKKNELFFILDDRDLVEVIKKAKDEYLVLGKDYGIISYNETLLKEIVEGGITTISTDFNDMGKKLAEMILNNDRRQIENGNSLIIRNSI